MNKLNTVHWPPASGRHDPVTSHEAEAEVTRGGKRRTHAEMVLAAVTEHPGETALFYGSLTGLGHIEAQRRLSDLTHKGLVRQGEPVTANRRRYVTWHPVLDEPSQGELL